MFLASVTGRMDRALQLAAPLAEAVDAAPAQFLAEQCSERAADARPWLGVQRIAGPR